MLGAAPALSQKGFEVDARCARQPAEGLGILRQRRRRNTLPEIVVIALGTNIAISARDIGRMLRAVGHRRTLMLVTPFRSWHPFHTRPMRRVARRHPQRVKLIDWSARATGNRQWFWSDGTHLRPTGVEVYTPHAQARRLVASARTLRLSLDVCLMTGLARLPTLAPWPRLARV